LITHLDWSSFGAEEWQTKLKRYTKAEHINLKSNPKKSGHPAVQMQGEAAKMLALLGTRDLVVALDERGQSCTSFDFANLLALAGMFPSFASAQQS
jgi:23S rRNA pseudoU1915 N3-methylase RlmH